MSDRGDILADCRIGAGHLHRAVRALRRELARRCTAPAAATTLLPWARKYLPEHFRLPPSGMHLWLDGQLSRMRSRRGEKLNVLGPRGGAKSTIATLAFPLWAALVWREPYIWIISDTTHQARAHLDNIKAELNENDRLAADYPDALPPVRIDRSNTIVLANGSVLQSFGTGQRIRGRRRRAHRPTLIVCDDLQNDQHMRSALQRENSRNWFHGTLLKAGTRRTNVVNLATALHREALAVQLCKTPGWTSRSFKAIERWPDNMSLWHQWESLYTQVDTPGYRESARAFYESHRREMDAGAEVLWPEEEDLYTLMCMRAESGPSAFDREKQNLPRDPALCEWPESYFDEHLWFDVWPRQLRVKTLALDPSKGVDARRGDYSAFVMLGVDRQGMLYLEADLARRPTPQIVADGVELYRRFQPDAFGLETNQFQELLGAEFEAEFRRQGILGARPAPIDNRVNKQVRIRRLGPYLATKRLRAKSDSPGTALLVEQLREFPNGDHDDGPDAAEMAIRLAARLCNVPADDGLGNRLTVG